MKYALVYPSFARPGTLITGRRRFDTREEAQVEADWSTAHTLGLCQYTVQPVDDAPAAPDNEPISGQSQGTAASVRTDEAAA